MTSLQAPPPLGQGYRMCHFRRLDRGPQASGETFRDKQLIEEKVCSAAHWAASVETTES